MADPQAPTVTFPLQTLGVAIPAGPISQSVHRQIEAALAAQVPAGTSGAVLFVLKGNKDVIAGGAALRTGTGWALSAEGGVESPLNHPAVYGELAVAKTW